MKKIITAVAIVAIIWIGFYFFTRDSVSNVNTGEQTATTTVPTDTATTTLVNDKETVIGNSAGGLPITAYHFGSGEKEILFVGGTHGGYSWNTALVAYETIDYLEDNLDKISSTTKVTVIPVLNPDGLNKVVGTTSPFKKGDVSSSSDTRVAGRFNGNGVDLNRNFDCDWKAEGVWQNKTVDGGDSAFSEPESKALKNYIESHKISAAVVWYSSAGGVFASNCHNGVLPETVKILDVFAKASGYPAHEEFDFYEVTGDLTNWLAKRGTPAISILLTTHEDTEWSKNQKGIDALLEYFAK